MNTDTHRDNPLLATDSLLPAYDRIEPKHVGEAVDILVSRCEQAIEQACSPDAPATHDFLARTIDVPMQALQEAWGVVSHLKSVCDTPELREAFMQSQPRVTALFTRLSSDLRLFRRYKHVLEAERASLSTAQVRALELEVQGFRLSGAELDDGRKARFARTRLRSAEVAREFSNNVLDATDAFAAWPGEAELAGVPEEVKRGLRQAAERAPGPGPYRCGLQQASLQPVLQFAHDRTLRRTLWCASNTRASEFGPPERDNGQPMVETLALRQERAELLGYANHGEISLQTKMADTPAKVIAFLTDLARRVRPTAEAEFAELCVFAREQLGLDSVQPWDMAYVVEQMRQQRFCLNDAEVRRYFNLDTVLKVVFEIAGELFDVTVKAENTPTWHARVGAWRVERRGELIGHVLFDPFARAGKQGGAWMSAARTRWKRPDGSVRTALGHVITNVAEPAAGEPPLISHRDVVTMFHEFGHLFHNLLSTVDVAGVAGIQGVEWDAVELPSQLMENFAWNPATIRRMSAHVDTGEPLPPELLDGMLAARNFMGGLGLLRQIEFSLFDMRLHTGSGSPKSPADVQAIFDEVRKTVSVLPAWDGNRFQNSFSHVFTGGYSAGYYSYLWAEVLAADAWSLFEQGGVLDREVGRRYREIVLERGGSRPMRENFRELMGREPSSAALLKARGLVAPG